MSALLQPAEEIFVPMSTQDLDEVVAVERSIYTYPWTRLNFQDSLAAGYSAWTLRDGAGSLIAYSIVMLVLDEGHLLNLSVAAPFQRRGHGWRILEWASSRAREHGAWSARGRGR